MVIIGLDYVRPFSSRGLILKVSCLASDTSNSRVLHGLEVQLASKSTVPGGVTSSSKYSIIFEHFGRADIVLGKVYLA